MEEVILNIESDIKEIKKEYETFSKGMLPIEPAEKVWFLKRACIKSNQSLQQVINLEFYIDNLINSMFSRRDYRVSAVFYKKNPEYVNMLAFSRFFRAIRKIHPERDSIDYNQRAKNQGIFYKAACKFVDTHSRDDQIVKLYIFLDKGVYRYKNLIIDIPEHLR